MFAQYFDHYINVLSRPFYGHGVVLNVFVIHAIQSTHYTVYCHLFNCVIIKNLLEKNYKNAKNSVARMFEYFTQKIVYCTRIIFSSHDSV